MKTTRIAMFALSTAAIGLGSGVAHAAPNFSVMQIDMLCPDFDGAMGPGNDAVLAAAAKRVYQGAPLGVNNGNGSACKKFVRNGKGGWFTARVTWSSDRNASLYVETTAAWAGSQGDEQHELILFLDGNGSAADFNKMYVDGATNIINDPGLTITVEVPSGNQWQMINQQRMKPVAWSLWAMHSGDSTDIYNQLAKLDQRINNIINTSNKYTDDQIAELHTHIHLELNAEAVTRTQNDATVLSSATSYTDQQTKTESSARIQQDTVLQAQIDGKVNSVRGAAPITSTGGLDPVIGLAPCMEGQVYTFSGGTWQCSSAAGPQAGPAIYNRNVAECMTTDLLTLQQGCSFALPNCVMQGDVGNACPAAPAMCSFAQTDTSQVCVEQDFQCEFWGCFPVCVRYETALCGNCDCTFEKVGYLLR